MQARDAAAAVVSITPESPGVGAGEREQMNIVIVGHVDHGKSTLVGRLLADTDSLPEGKLDSVRAICERQGKTFEYAFLLDALEAEQDQGITIDAARCFFKTALRDYIIIDAPGHVEFLKNMVTGAARAEAAVLLIDADEGVQENSRRHGYLLSMLGVSQVAVVANKMDLVDYSQERFESIRKEYIDFLRSFGVEPAFFVPISAREGDFVANRSPRMGWYEGPTVLECIDQFAKAPPASDLPLRFPVQDVYKFTRMGDDRRIVAGRVETGSFAVGDEVVFSPSQKRSRIRTIEEFSAPERETISAGHSTGVTLTEQIYVARGEVMSHVDDAPCGSDRFLASLFWLGKEPMRAGRAYKLKMATRSVEVWLDEIHRVIDASDLGEHGDNKQIGRHEVAEVVLRTRNPIAFDRNRDNAALGRFVIVDGYDIAGGGIVREPAEPQERTISDTAHLREFIWHSGDVTHGDRERRAGHAAALVMISGDAGVGKARLARSLERYFFDQGRQVYLLDGENPLLQVDDSEIADEELSSIKDELTRRFSDVLSLFVDAGMIVVSTTNPIGLASVAKVEEAVAHAEILTVHITGDVEAMRRNVDIVIDDTFDEMHEIKRIETLLRVQGVLPER